MAEVVEINDGNFEEKVMKASKVVLVDFAASWCPPCKIMEPIIKAVAAGVGDKAIVGHLDVDESRGMAAKYGVLSVPTMIFFKKGKEEARLVGVNQKENIIAKIEALSK